MGSVKPLQLMKGITMIAAHCLALAIYFEARGQSYHGQEMVAAVVMNRVEDSRWPNNVCDVVFQPRQFSWVRNGKHPRVRNQEAWEIAEDIAAFVLESDERITDANHFFSGPAPYWADSMDCGKRVGGHKFCEW